MDELMGRSTARLLVRAGRDDDEVVAALVDWLGLTMDQAAAALRAAKNGCE
jgi:hypothetical protein